jgi:hypothetical protein
MRLTLIANPGDKRVTLRQAARARAGLPPADVVAYADLLTGRTRLEAYIRPGSAVRFESPGRDWDVERLLIAAGAAVADSRPAERITAADALRLEFDRGRLRFLRQWYLGWRRMLGEWGRELRELEPDRPHRRFNDPDEIAVMVDKPACIARFAAAGVAVPEPLGGEPRTFDELRDAMLRRGMPRVFVKSSHGSSAAGAVALAVHPSGDLAAYTTTETVREAGSVRFYSSRRVRRLDRRRDVAPVVDYLLAEGAQVERWLPKAQHRGRGLDLRVVVTAGRATHAVVRLSRSPMTNLHLLNERAALADLGDDLPPDRWTAARAACEAAAGCFPGTLASGVDLLFSAGFRRHAVPEINAFGDLLPGTVDLHGQGGDTYDWQTRAECLVARGAVTEAAR